jgi:hypothetical protein
MMLKKAKAQALARALATARRQQAQTQHQEQQQPQQNGTIGTHDAAARQSGDAAADDVPPQPMTIDGMAHDANVNGSPPEQQKQQYRSADDSTTVPQHTPNGHTAGQQQGAEAPAQQQSPADAAKAKQQEEAHSAALRRHLIQARKDALTRRRQDEYEAEEARKQRCVLSARTCNPFAICQGSGTRILATGGMCAEADTDCR